MKSLYQNFEKKTRWSFGWGSFGSKINGSGSFYPSLLGWFKCTSGGLGADCCGFVGWSPSSKHPGVDEAALWEDGGLSYQKYLLLVMVRGFCCRLRKNRLSRLKNKNMSWWSVCWGWCWNHRTTNTITTLSPSPPPRVLYKPLKGFI